MMEDGFKPKLKPSAHGVKTVVCPLLFVTLKEKRAAKKAKNSVVLLLH